MRSADQTFGLGGGTPLQLGLQVGPFGEDAPGEEERATVRRDPDEVNRED
jgi:hypothetical protein